MKTQSMRKLSLAALLVLAGITLFAQNSKRTTAYNYMRDGELDKAVKPINEAIKHKRTKDDEKTWRYRGDIFLRIAIAKINQGKKQKDKEKAEKLRNKYPHAVKRAYESYKKSEELDDKDRYDEERQQAMSTLNQLALNEGVGSYNAKNYEEAADHFITAIKARAAIGQKDTLAIYNAGLAYENSGKPDSAIVYYKKATKLDYLGPKLYLYIANIYQKQKDDQAYLNIVNKGLDKYPENKNLNLYRLNYYLKNKKFDEAKASLNKAIEKDPNNKTLHYSLGAVHDELGNYQKAMASYKKALAIDSSYFDATYNLGALIFNKGVQMNNAANEIEDNDKYEAKRKEARQVFEKALPYLQKAHNLESDNVDTIQSLMQLYAFLDKKEKYKSMKALLNEKVGKSQSKGKMPEQMEEDSNEKN